MRTRSALRRTTLSVALLASISSFFIAAPGILAQRSTPLRIESEELNPDLVPQLGHVNRPSSIFLSNDASLMVTVSPDKIILWDPSNGKQLRTFLPTQNGLNYVGAALSVDGETVIALDGYGLDFWNALTGKLVRQVKLPQVGALGVQSMRLSPDGSRLLLSRQGGSGSSGAPLIFSLASDKPVVDLEGKYRFGSYALAFSFNGRQIADGNYEQFVRIHDAIDGKLIAEFTPKAGPVESVAFSPDGSRVAATTNDNCHSLDPPGTSNVGSALRPHDCTGHIFVWDLQSKTLLWSSPSRQHTVGEIVFSATDRLMLAFGTDIEEWTIPSSTPARTIETHQPVSSFVINTLHDVIAATGWTTEVAALRSGVVRWTAHSKSDLVSSFAVSAANRELVIGERSGSLLFFSSTDSADTRLLRSTKISDDWIQTLAISDPSGLIAVPCGDADDRVRILKLKDSTFVRDVHTSLTTINSLAFSADGKVLAVAGDSRDQASANVQPNPEDPTDLTGLFTKRVTVVLFDAVTGVSLRKFMTDGTVSDIAFARNGVLIAHMQFSSELWKWKVTDGSLLYAPHRDATAPPQPFSSSLSAVSSDGSTLAEYDGSNLTLVDTATLRPKSHRISIFDLQRPACAFSPDGSLVAVSGEHIAVFRTDNGQKIRDMIGQDSHVSGLRFSDDAKFLFSTSFDGTLRIWNTGSGDLLVTLLFVSDDGSHYEWLAITPDGLFDGTTNAMQSVAWRTHNTNRVWSLDGFFTDYYQPGIFGEIISGRRPRAHVDIATALQVPGLRMMLAEKLAHPEMHGDRLVICFNQMPGAAIRVGPTDQRIVFPPVNGYEPGTTPTCKFEKSLITGNTSSAAVIDRLLNWKPEVVTSPWDGELSDTSHSNLNVLTIGITDYPQDNRFPRLPWAVPSAKAIEDFFRQQQSNSKKPYAEVRVWGGLYDQAASREKIRQRLSDMAQEVTRDDVVLLYLAGHGQVSPGAEMFYFVPFDKQGSDLQGTAISTAMIAEALRNLPARRIILIVDACQSGGAIEALSKIGTVKAQVEELRRWDKRRPAPGEHGIGVHLIAATLPLSYATGPAEGKSVLVQTLIQGLAHGDERVTASHLAAFTKDRLPSISDASQGFRQVPLVNSIGLDFPLK